MSKQCTTTDKGYTMFLDNLDSLLLSKYGHYEFSNTYTVDRLLHKGNTFVDVGAHIGYYTVIASKIVGDAGRVFAFEPDPTNFALLERNIEANGCKNVTAVQKAVSDKTGYAKLYICPDNTGGNRIYHNMPGHRSIDIETVKLDDYFKNYDQPIDFVKVDVEGAERLVIQGMESMLKKNGDIKIIIEFCADVLKQCIDPTTALKQLAENELKLYFIDPYKIDIFPVSIEKAIEMCDDLQVCISLLCMKKLIIVTGGTKQ